MKRKIEIIAETKVDGKPLKVGHKGFFDSKTASTLVNNHKGKYIDVEDKPKVEAEGTETERAETAEGKVAELEDGIKAETERAETAEGKIAELEDGIKAETERADAAEAKVIDLEKALAKKDKK